MRRGIAFAVALASLLAAAPSASADFHLMKIRQIRPATGIGPGQNAYVELQMYSAGQTNLAGHTLTQYDADGGVPTGTFPFPAQSLDGGNQRSILISTGNPDGVPFDFFYPGLGMGSAGAVCFDTIDCVSWGAFTGDASLPSSAGTPLPAFTTAVYTRSIGAGCATQLDPPDDTNDSAADFSVTARAARNNAAVPSETACQGTGPGGDLDPPNTEITKAPAKKTKKKRVKFAFTSTEQGSRFDCKLDRGAFKACVTPFSTTVKPGKHTFSVRAIDAAENIDPTPASTSFKVKKKKRR